MTLIYYYRSFKSSLVLLLFSCFFSYVVSAANNGEIFVDSANLWKGINSIQEKSFSRGEIAPEIALKPNIKRDFTVNIQYTACKNLYYWDFDNVMQDNQSTLAGEYAYDGTYFQYLSKPSLSLYLYKNKDVFLKQPLAAIMHAMFRPYVFLKKEQVDNPAFVLRFEDLQSADRWNELSKRGIFVENGQLGDELCEIWKFPAWGGELCWYKVWFSKKNNGFPIYWEYYNAKKEKRFTYKVTKMAFVVSTDGKVKFPYAQEAQELAFSSKGEVGTTITHKVSSVSINKIDEDIFQIDPAKAKVIYDGESGVLINTPR